MRIGEESGTENMHVGKYVFYPSHGTVARKSYRTVFIYRLRYATMTAEHAELAKQGTHGKTRHVVTNKRTKNKASKTNALTTTRML